MSGVQSKQVVVLGMSYKTAPASLRETLALTPDQARRFLVAGREAPPEAEAVLLSTCNRTELYLSARDTAEAAAVWLERLGAFAGRSALRESRFPHYRLEGPAAAEHLMRVACGLESAVLGEMQILGQIRRALVMSSECGTLGPHSQRLFELAIRAGARARQRTSISRGAASFGSSLAGTLRERFSGSQEHRPARILIIGAGETAADVARQLGPVRRLAGPVTVVGRTKDKARAFADSYRLTVRPWSSLWECVAESDVVVAATSCRKPILTCARLTAAARARGGRRLLVVDLGMPRNAERCSSVELIDIDSLREKRNEALGVRENAVPDVEEIALGHVLEWRRRSDFQVLDDALKSLYLMAGSVSQEATDEILALRDDSPEQVRHIVLRSMKRLLHAHVRTLRASGPPNAFLTGRHDVAREEARAALVDDLDEPATAKRGHG